MVEQYKKQYVFLGVTLLLWLLFCWNGIVSAIEVWWTNDIFNHGFLIIPASLYLVFLNRDRLIAVDKGVSLLPLTIILPSCILYVVGVAGDIQLFMHTAAFVLLPSLIWMNIGHQAARVILFPLLFMLFSIPVGEQLIPYLQEIAADGSVALLRVTGIPLYRNGLYLDIPQGRFLVAEACSGVSFFIASIVIGFLYTYLNLQSLKKQIFFVLLSFLFPVAANIVRIYGIILIAYHTDMEHAAGADHLIYGWFFFAFVIVCLLGIGELLRDKVQPNIILTERKLGNWEIEFKKSASLFTVLLCFLFWSKFIHTTMSSISAVELKSEISIPVECNSNTIELSPIFINPDKVKQTMFEVNTACNAVLYEVWFSGQENELVTDLNKPYTQQKWSLINDDVTLLIIDDQSIPVRVITSPSGQKVRYALWFEVDERIFTNKVQAKLYQTWLVLWGMHPSGKLIILGVDSTSSFTDALDVVNP